MAVTVSNGELILDGNETEGGSPTEVDVGPKNPSINDVGVDTGAGGIPGVTVIERELALVEPIESPRWGGRLRSRNRHDAVSFDTFHARIAPHRCDGLRAQLNRETSQRVLIHEEQSTADCSSDRSRCFRNIGD
jgi:hypothetical protein